MSPTQPTVRLLIVDHSPAAREKLRYLFESKPDIQVVGDSGTHQKTLRLLEEASPTAVLVDCEMPQPGSFALVREMMAVHRVPIVMLTKKSRIVPKALEDEALEAGAVTIVALTLEGLSTEKMGQDALVRTVRAMSEVKVVRRRSGRVSAASANAIRDTAESARPPRTGQTDHSTPEEREAKEAIELLAIGASTGGPQVIETILKGLSKRLTVPVLVVQHLSQGFQNNLIHWLSEASGTQIRVPQHGMLMTPGIVYLAPDSKQMEVNGSGRIILTDDPPENGSRPSVSVLFRSVAKHYGPRAIGVLLTGMGRDGAKELLLMRELGAVTIAQDEETSAVHGMPGEAIKLKGARYVLPPDRIVKVIESRLPAATPDPREAAFV